MRILTYIAPYGGILVKNVMKSHFRLASSLVTELKKTGGIRVNDSIVTVRKLMDKDDKLTLIIPDDIPSDIVPVEGSLDILYEDEDILCVSKPSGMPTHPSRNHYTDTLANIVCHYYRDTNFTFRVSNRLDRYTSGVVIVAKNMYSASFLCTNEFRKTMHKTYYAICRGSFENREGTVNAPISRLEGSVIKREVSPLGKYAETHYSVVSENNGTSLVKLMPKTGRTHQIRVHMAYIGHPLKNDFLYDDKCDGTSAFYLHCNKISFVHPINGMPMEVEAPVSDKILNF